MYDLQPQPCEKKPFKTHKPKSLEKKKKTSSYQTNHTLGIQNSFHFLHGALSENRPRLIPRYGNAATRG